MAIKGSASIFGPEARHRAIPEYSTLLKPSIADTNRVLHTEVEPSTESLNPPEYLPRVNPNQLLSLEDLSNQVPAIDTYRFASHVEGGVRGR